MSALRPQTLLRATAALAAMLVVASVFALVAPPSAPALASRATTPSAQAVTGPAARTVFVVVPGLGLPGMGREWPSALTSMAAGGAVGLMPSGHALKVAAYAVQAGAPVLNAANAKDLAQLAEWAAAPGDAVGVPRFIVARVATVTPALADPAWNAQLGKVARVLVESTTTTAILVAPAAGGPPALTPVVVHTPGTDAEAVLDSPDTRRAGVVSAGAVTSIAKFRVVGDGAPFGINAVAVGLTDKGAPLEDRLRTLRTRAEAVAAVDSIRWYVFDLWAASLLGVLAIAGLVAWRAPAGSPWRRIAAVAVPAPVGVPLAAYVTALVTRDMGEAMPIVVVMAAVTAIVVAATVALGAAKGPAAGAAGILGLTAIVILLDQWLGAPLLAANIAGYSLAEGGRFFGLGNEGAALLVASVASVAALLAPDPDGPGAKRFAVLAGVGFLVVVASCVAPWWGANIGVALWGIPFFVIVWDGLRPASWPRSLVAVVTAGAVLVVGALVVADAALQLTHIGRTIVAALAGGGAGAILAERAGTAVRVFTGNPWTLALIAMLGVLAWLVIRPPEAVGDIELDAPSVRALVVAALVGALIGLVTEDTGTSVAGPLAFLSLAVLVIEVLAPPERLHDWPPHLDDTAPIVPVVAPPAIPTRDGSP